MSWQSSAARLEPGDRLDVYTNTMDVWGALSRGPLPLFVIGKTIGSSVGEGLRSFAQDQERGGKRARGGRRGVVSQHYEEENAVFRAP